MEQIIRFETKEESNGHRMQEALARTGHGRLLFFFQLCEKSQYSVKDEPLPNWLKGNFVLK